MKRKSSKFLSLLLAAVLLLSLIAPAALAAGTADTIYLRTAEDLAGFSRNCTLDSWSQGKTVYLEADIDLTGVDFAPSLPSAAPLRDRDTPSPACPSPAAAMCGDCFGTYSPPALCGISTSRAASLPLTAKTFWAAWQGRTRGPSRCVRFPGR